MATASPVKQLTLQLNNFPTSLEGISHFFRRPQLRAEEAAYLLQLRKGNVSVSIEVALRPIHGHPGGWGARSYSYMFDGSVRGLHLSSCADGLILSLADLPSELQFGLPDHPLYHAKASFTCEEWEILNTGGPNAQRFHQRYLEFLHGHAVALRNIKQNTTLHAAPERSSL